MNREHAAVGSAGGEVVALGGRPRRVGATQAGGDSWSLTRSTSVQTWSVRPGTRRRSRPQ